MTVTKEPDGLPYVENCDVCGKPTRYWVGGGKYPLCQKCDDHLKET